MTINEFKKSPIQTFVALLGVLGVIFNIYLSTKLAPLAEDNRSITRRVEAIEDYKSQTSPLVERFIISEQKILQMQLDISDMKTDVKDIKSLFFKK